LISKGHRKFIVLGDGEVSGIVEVALKSRADGTLIVRRTQEEMPHAEIDEVVLDCRLGRNPEAVGISVLEEILGPGTMEEIPAPQGSLGVEGGKS
jgi:hypothetical protein